MAQWKSLKIADCIEMIDREELVLPVVQRDFVWKSEKIELLFDTLLKGDSFGGVMTIKDLKGKKPIFSYRHFIKNFKRGNSKILSKEVERLKDSISYVVDGQQRLSAFYIGLEGSYNDKELYFDLLSEIEHKNFNFKFVKDETSRDLKSKIDNFDGTKKIETFWYSLKEIYSKIDSSGGDYYTVFDEIIDESEALERGFSSGQKERIKRNIENITNQIFNFSNIGICEVRLDKNSDEVENRMRVVELFRRLNQGGTKLDGFELMASKLKGFDPENEIFLESIEKFKDIGFSKDEVIKLIFILQDDHKKSIVNITKKDSDFIKSQKDRVQASLDGCRSFLEQSNLYRFFKEEKPSIIPLYFITYFLFHKNLDSDKIRSFFHNSEINNRDYNLIYRWIYLSLLNKVFRRRGAGWTAYSTGIRKILNIIKNYKGRDFPTEKLFDMYNNHPLDFDSEIKISRLNSYDFDFLFYVIYEKPKNFRKNDLDHIHPKSILKKKGYENSKINSIANYQLLDYSTNRGDKNDKELSLWIENSVKNRDLYLREHLIPSDPRLWNSDNFESFLEQRAELIIEKLKRDILD